MTVRELGPRDLAGALAAAQRALAAAGPGARETWQLPPGEYRLAGPLAVGVPGASLTLRGDRGTRLLVSLPGGPGEGAALTVSGATVEVEALTVAARAGGPLTAVRLSGGRRAVARDVEVRDARGGTVTAIAVVAPAAEVTGCRVAGARAGAGAVTGIDVVATGSATVARVALADLAGERVTGLAVHAPAGTVDGVAVERAAATAEAPVAVAADPGVTVTGVTVERHVVGDAAALVAALAEAQQRLAAAPPGTAETWVLPAGEFALPAGLVLGAAGRDLRVTGTRAAGGTELVFDGAADPVAVDVVGDRVAVSELAVRGARSSGPLTAVRVRAEAAAEIEDVAVRDVRGGPVTLGVEVNAPEISLVDVTVEGVRGDDTAFAVGVRGDRVALSRVTVRQVAAPSVTALAVEASVAATAALVLVEDVVGPSVEGSQFRVIGPPTGPRELSLLDVRVRRVRSTGADQDTIGLSAFCSGDAALRGVSVETVEGARAIGLLLVAAAAVDWVGGTVTDVRGTTAGASGVRLLALPSRSPVSVRDVQVEGVRAAAVGPAAAPPESWRDLLAAMRPWVGEATAPGPPVPFLTGRPGHVEDVVGLHVCAPVDETEPWTDTEDPGPIRVTECVLRRVSGTALQVDGELRDVEVRGVEAWTAVRAGWVAGNRVLVAASTWHRHGTGLEFGPCTLTAADCLLTGVVTGAGLVPGPETEVGDLLATYATGGVPPLRAEPVPPPYVVPGPAGIPPSVLAGALAPAAAVDLRLADAALHATAVRVPGDPEDVPVHLGAHPPDTDARCALRDPFPAPAEPVLAPVPVGAGLDYRTRDARGLLALMTDRARHALPGWSDTGPADHVAMWLELVAERLDAAAYRQEAAVTEGWLGTALLRRSAEDHARLVDYEPDPGLSATAMIRFRLGAEGAAELGLAGVFEHSGRLALPAGTLLVNPDAADRLVVFGTESTLLLDPALDELRLAGPVGPGDTAALLAGDLTGLEVGRWLVLVAIDPGAGRRPGPPGLDGPELTDPDVPGHVVRVTRVELGVDTTLVSWDPRRPAPVGYEPGTCRVYGNVVPAHHGLPVTPLSVPGGTEVLETDELLRPWRERLTVRVDGPAGVREVPLPVGPVSVHAAGWPFPGRPDRTGLAQLAVAVDGEPWDLVDGLATLVPGDEAVALRTGADGGAAVRFGDGRNGAALPAREVAVDLAVQVGLGGLGNVAAGTLERLLAIGEGADADLILGDGGADRFALIRRHLVATNPLPAVGGRDAEPTECIRYRAPLAVRDLRGAVVPADYERLLGELPEVGASRARAFDAGPRHVVRVTLLLAGEDELAAAGDAGENERLRRWAVARERLEAVRLLGYDVELVPPAFVPLDLDLAVDMEPGVDGDDLRVAVEQALAGAGGLFDPDVSGLGGDVHLDTLHRRVLAVPGVTAVRVRRLRRLEPGAVERSRSGVLPVGAEEVAVLRHPYGPGFAQGLLTVEVCGVPA